MKKKIQMYVGGLLLMSSLSLDTSIDNLAQGLYQLTPEAQKFGKKGRSSDYEYGSPERIKLLKTRVREARERADLKEITTPKQAYDEFILSSVSLVEILATDFANAVANVIQTSFKDESLAQAIRRMPAAIANGILLGYELATRVAFPADVRKQYLDLINKAGHAASCLAQKAGKRQKSEACSDFSSGAEAFAELLGTVRELLLPFLQVGLLGVTQANGNTVDGLLMQATMVIAPQYTDHVQYLQSFGQMFNNTLEQTKQLVESENADQN